MEESVTCYLAAYNQEKSSEESASDTPTASWAKVVERISIEMEDVLRGRRTELSALERRSLVRLAENLVRVCSHQLEAPDGAIRIPLNSTVYWVLLHRVIEFEESRLALIKKEEFQSRAVANAEKGEDPAEDDEDDDDDDDEPLPCSILFLMSSHDLLGKRSWCMQGGTFVPYALEVRRKKPKPIIFSRLIFFLCLFQVLMRKRRTTLDPDDREELGRAIEQASYCSTGYPTSKKIKNRYMADHGAVNVPYTWNRVLLLADFFLPSRQELPEFDTVKPTLTAEQEMLLQKIVSLIPPELDPKNKLDDIQDFIQVVNK